MRDAGLWERLNRIGFPASRGCALADEVRAEFVLSARKADRAVTEYARFLYLNVTAEEQVAPSPFLAEVWSLHQQHHLEYLAMIREVIGTDLRDPSRRSDFTHDPACARTLALCREEFGQKPPIKVRPLVVHLKRGKLLTIWMLAALLGTMVAFAVGAETVTIVLGLAVYTLSGLSFLTRPWGTWKRGDAP
jgi:hypothetical protein